MGEGEEDGEVKKASPTLAGMVDRTYLVTFKAAEPSHSASGRVDRRLLLR
jgi:hypothetical protein